MSVTLQKNGKFLAYVGQRGSEGEIQRWRKSFDSKAEAQAWEAETRLLLKAGKTPEQVTGGHDNWTLQTAARRAFEERWVGTKGAGTASKNTHAALEFFGPKTHVDLITTQRVEEYINHLKRTNSGATINRKLAALSVVLKTAYKHDKMKRLPILTRQKEALQRPRWLSQEDVERLTYRAKAMAYDDVADAIILAAYTGIRQSELLNLDATSFNKKRRELLLLDTKNGKDHRVPLSARPFAILEARAKWGKVFDMNASGLNARWDRIRQMEGIEARWHDLRHTFGSWMVQKGVPIETVSRLMNHSSIQVTMRYAYLAPSNYHDAVSVLD